MEDVCGSCGPRVARRTFLGAGLAAAAALAACGAEASPAAAPAGRRSVSPAARSSTPPSSSAPTARHPSPSGRAPGGPATELVRAVSGRPEVALTFHTNGDVGLVDRLFAAVQKSGAPITCMFVCDWLALHPSYARRVTDLGGEVGNHTWTHLADLDREPEAVVREQVVRSRDILDRVAGTPGAFFRPSAMHHATTAVLREAGASGYAHTLSYDVDPEDYRDPGPELVVSRTLAAVRPGSVVSLHFGHAGTIPAFPRIVSGLRAKGLTPVTASALFA